MYPVLFKFGWISIYTYGFFIALGFIAGITLAKREAERLGEDANKIIDVAFYIIIAAILGSRLFYVAINYKIYIKDPLEIFKIWNGGLVFYGGFIAAVITSFIYLKKNKMPLCKTADIIAPSLAIGHSFGRIGCFFAGCCYGKECTLPWAVTFTNPDCLAPLGKPIHPTQLYSCLSNLVIFIILWLLRKRKKKDGQLFWLYVLLYGTVRSFMEMLRGDFRGETVFGIFSISQIIGITAAFTAIIILIYLGSSKNIEKE